MTVIYAEPQRPMRLDIYLALETGRTRSHIKQLIDGGHVLLLGERVKGGKVVSMGDLITIDEPPQETDIVPQDIPLDILYEDEHIAVINKQSGLTVHPAGGANTNTLVNALLFHFKNLSKLGGDIRPGIVHRLDKDTTGAMVVAKNDSAHLALSRQIAERGVIKLYHAILEGRVKDDNGKIETMIGRSRNNRKMMATDCGGRESLTLYKALERFESNTYVEFDLKTGRTHQIRLHARHIGHPVVGDPVYGYKKQRFSLQGQLLHSHYLEFLHPASGQKVGFTAPLPKEFERILDILRR